MPRLSGDLWREARAFSALPIDHIGLVVDDIEKSVCDLRQQGLRVSDPQPLWGENGPMGQVSAHRVFANGYIELSTPVAGTGNHLEPLLACGGGWRILVLACADCAAEQSILQAAGIDCGPIAQASREVHLSSGRMRARFSWFSVPDLVPGLLVAYVRHLDRDIVFAQQLTQHPGGAERIEAVLLGTSAAALGKLRPWSRPDAPHALLSALSELPVVGVELSGGRPFALEHRSWQLRAGPAGGAGEAGRA